MMRILFVTHSLSRTGAPNVLLTICKWISLNLKWKVDIVYYYDIDLLKDFNMFTENVYDFKEFKNEFKNEYKRFFFNSLIKKKTFYNVIYFNSAASLLDYDWFFSNFEAKYVLHFHEMYSYLTIISNKIPIDRFISSSNLIIAASSTVKADLYKIYPSLLSSIDIVNEFIDSKKIFENLNNNDDTYFLNFIQNKKLILGSGTLDIRKGIDIFINIAEIFHSDFDLNIVFVWVGGIKDSLEYSIIQNYINNIGLKDKVLIIPNCTNPFFYFSKCDVFFCSSREDPFPLVCLEANLLKKPVLFLKGFTGLTDYFDSDNSVVFDSLNRLEICSWISDYVSDRDIHFNYDKGILDMDIVVPVIIEKINSKLLNG